MSAHVVQWVTASPLWPDVLEAEDTAAMRARMRRPALLRFASDSFMEDLADLLADDPGDLAAHEAQPESFRPPPPGADPGWTPDDLPLKLFQAAHGRFYLVAATLACRVPGLPEHPADAARRETVAFVLRRVHEGAEYAWVTRAPATAPGWAKADTETELVKGEDQLPLFPLNYEHRERRRRLYIGLVPTSSRETFNAAGPLSPLEGEPPLPGQTVDPRRQALEARVLAPMRDLPRDPAPGGPLTEAERLAATEAAAAQRREISRFALVELIALLKTSIPELFQAIVAGAARPSGDAGTLHDRFGSATTGTLTWRQALKTAWDQRLAIAGEDDSTTITLAADLRASTLSAEDLDELFAKALPPLTSPAGAAGAAGANGPPAPVAVPKLDARGEAVYVLRCVYRRPHCGPLQPDVVSDPTREFTIASFYDLDAPVRPVMISLPIDTNLKDLRRYPKGVSFLISDQLRKQMSRVTTLKEALDGSGGPAQPFNLGVICAFSLPIITLVALILMMMIVSLLNFIFGWMPYLRVCFPLALKGKP